MSTQGTNPYYLEVLWIYSPEFSLHSAFLRAQG
jgi:hypothetical protein